MTVTIYHNPACSNSRKALALIREAGVEPTVIEYLKNPPTRDTLTALIAAMGMSPRDLVRTKEPAYAELDLGNPALNDVALIDAMAGHPALINRPIVTTPRGTALCRPPERVLDLLPGGAAGGRK